MVHRNTKVIAAISALLFIASAAALGVFSLMLVKQKALYAERSLERAQERARQESVQALLQTLDDTKDARESLSTRILREEDVIDLLSLVEALGRENAAPVETDSLTVEPLDDMFETLVVHLNVTGSYASVLRMLTLLEALPYQATISAAHLSAEGDGWGGELELRITKFKKI